ncbi:MAG TPA: hypothetical protein VKC63_04015 [Solirubrobacterales bacterium]|nr:hypothetical protein [Solirubrobacterales bacterium]
MSPARLLLPVLAATLLTAGCGSSGKQAPTATATTPAAPPGASARACSGTFVGTGEVRVTGVSCDAGRGVVSAWVYKRACTSQVGVSRFSCSVHGGYRCLGAATERGIAVSCARPGSSVAFIAKHG